MEKEISNGAMLGIVLIALAAIIGLGFGVFAIAKGVANEGVTGVQENLDVVNSSAFTDYDQKIVTGTQVVSAIQNFEGKNVSILIATSSMKNAAVENKVSQGAGVSQSYKPKGGEVPGVYALASKDSTSGYAMSTSGDTDLDGSKNTAFINYNALLMGTVDGTGEGEEGTGKGDYVENGGSIYFDNNCFRTTKGFETESGRVLFNNITGNLSKSGMMEYVSTSARFQSFLIKDDSGTIMGVAFEQINSGK